jgi:hypothetical protein
MKKKLTKTQVKRKLKTATNALYDLLLDKMGHGTDSGISMSFAKLYEIHKALGGTMRRAYK